MAFKPNYGRDRAERERAARARSEEKQKKKEEKLAQRKAEREAAGSPPEGSKPDGEAGYPGTAAGESRSCGTLADPSGGPNRPVSLARARFSAPENGGNE